MTGSPENYKGQYASLKFDPYKYRDFPKAVYVNGKMVGEANNLMEEKELYAEHGIDKGDIDPMGALKDENAELRAKLAQFEAGQPAVGRSTGVKTNTVQMLSEEAGKPQKMGPGDGEIGDNVIPEHLEDSPRGANPTYNPPPGGDPANKAVPKPGQTAEAKPNPLLAGKPGPQGSAPQVQSPIKDGH